MGVASDVRNIPWFADKVERQIYAELGYACVFGAGPEDGDRVKLGWAIHLPNQLGNLQDAHWKRVTLRSVVWTAGEPLARRLLHETEELLRNHGRHLNGHWYDVPDEMLNATLAVLARKMVIPTFTHEQMLDRVRLTRESRIEKTVRSAGLRLVR